VWSRKGSGLIGIGVAARLEFRGESRMRDAAAVWRELASRAEVADGVGAPGAGLIAFGAFPFSPDSRYPGVLIVPEVVIGRRDGQTWITRIRDLDAPGTRPESIGASARSRFPGARSSRDAAARAGAAPAPIPLGAEYRISLLPGSLGPADYQSAVARAVQRIRAGELSKVVLARDLVGHLPLESDLRRTLVEFALGYPDCWTYAVDGLVGASPETWVRVDRGEVSARVLAGTVSRGADAASDHEAALALAMSHKDQDEHRYAVQSVSEALRAHTTRLRTSELPFTLKLPNLWHLATDVAGTLADGSISLDLIDALHPTAAVAGAPTEQALRVIRESEPFDRGRYAGPVGWVAADGDGEWAIALRGAQVTADGDITAFAGAGIVAESDPSRELAETTMKFRPVVEAFG
jgi:menaquinone-specific isochorismate synthase